MFLKSIELFGFKSFADRSTIEFSDGISALLGPNGCGKSNVVDAIKWVLGEQGTKSLRAERMEDVIFNGTEGRKPLNVAEVTITLVNEEGLLPIDSPEIAVRRRLFRNGESDYSVNGTSVKLRELREMFYDTGIGKSSYSIMEQGKIDQILSTKPEERRLIFEEAAGITKYRAKGKEAERKLERTVENVKQVNGILGEVKRSYDSLERQSKKTMEYRALREDLFNIELDLILLKLKNLAEERDKRRTQLTEKTEARDGLRTAIDGINESLEENLDIVNEMETKLVEQQKRLYRIELQKGGHHDQLRLLSERAGELKQSIESELSRETSFASRIEELDTEITGLRASVDEHIRRIGEVEANLTEFTERVDHAAARIEENKKRIVELHRVISSCETEEERLGVELREITDSIVTQLDEGLSASGYSRTRRMELEEQLTALLDEITIQIQGRRTMLQDALQLTEPSERGKTVEQHAAAVDALLERFGRLRNVVEQYRGALPSFLDEFLAPEGIITKKRDIDARLAQTKERERVARAEIDALSTENADLGERIAEFRSTIAQLRVNRAQMTTQVTGLNQRIKQAGTQRAEQEQQRVASRDAIDTARARLEQTNARSGEITQELETLNKDEAVVQKELEQLEEGISVRNKELAGKERSLKTRMEEMGRLQNQVEHLQAGLAETSTEIRSLYENFRDRYSRDLTEYESRMLEIDADARDLRRKQSELRERERSLGSVNLMAPEEFQEVSERYSFLSEQLQDLEQARTDLERVTTEIQSESAEIFMQTYDQIKKNFHAIFRRLFGGGRAELRLSEPDDVLESGVDILAQPPGKKLENIALLSGGERSLTAVAVLFATYMVRPSPFCLLDEIDAALDESNVGRFTNMLMEFAHSSQFIVITHNKKTVAAASTLLGVTMEESGVSKVVSIRIAGKEPVHAS